MLEATCAGQPDKLFALKKFFSTKTSKRHEEVMTLHRDKLQDSTLQYLMRVLHLVDDKVRHSLSFDIGFVQICTHFPIIVLLAVQTCSGKKIVVTEKATGSLADLIEDGGLSRDAAKAIFLDILAGKQEMDDRNIIHVRFMPVHELHKTELLSCLHSTLGFQQRPLK